MTSPHRRRSPGEGITGASANNDNNPSVERCDTREHVAAIGPRHRPHPDLCQHARPAHRYCRRCTRGRRAIGRELSGLCRSLEPIEPSDYGLAPEDVRAEANRLWSLGWSVREIAARLPVVAK